MKKIALLVFISLFMLGCSLPFTINWKTTPTSQVETPAPIAATVTVGVIATEAPATVEAPTAEPANGVQKNLGGIFMVLPPCMANDATGTLVPAVPYDENNGPMEYHPQFRKIAFQGYPISGSFFDPSNTEHGGISIYPIAEFTAMNQMVASEIAEMQTLLTNKPAAPDSIPLLPNLYAAQVFSTNEKYLAFQNGQGIRFLTEYAQYSAPVNNHDLFYTFQGITADGKYWVSAFLPVNAAYLQEAYDSVVVPAGGIPAPAMDDPNYSTSMEAYYVSMLNKLNTTPENTFTPGLDCLDQYIQSLSVSD